jgi:hypothetical protein
MILYLYLWLLSHLDLSSNTVKSYLTEGYDTHMSNDTTRNLFIYLFLVDLVFFDSFKNTIHRSHPFNRCSSNGNNRKKLVLEFSIYVTT